MTTFRLSSLLNREKLLRHRETAEDIHQHQLDNAALDITFIFILILAASIATLGLASNSPATVVGAMLISPLMKPILALAYGIATSNRPLMQRSLITLLAGILITLFTSALVENALSLYEPTEEILARIQPSLIDMCVAVAAAAAGSLAATRKDISATLPGVAIAVSLVPPLCVTGIGLSVRSVTIALGSLTLFTINLAAIVLVAAVIFLIEGQGTIRRASPYLLVAALAVAGLTFSLNGAQYTLLHEDQAHEVIEDYLRESYLRDHIAHPGDLNRVIVMDYPDHTYVFAEIKAMPEKFTEAELTKLHDLLKASIGAPVNLKVLLVHANELTLYEAKLPETPEHEYGIDILVPKK